MLSDCEEEMFYRVLPKDFTDNYRRSKEIKRINQNMLILKILLVLVFVSGIVLFFGGLMLGFVHI